jgi:gliding motility-associated-like protein
VVNPLVQLDNTNLSAINVCFGTDIQINISGASSLPDGVYQFNYTIPTAVPTTGNSGNLIIAAGSGLFTVPSALFTNAGIYSITITGITTASGCGNLTEDATTTFEILPLPNLSGALVSAGTTCVNFFNQVTISGATNLPDGIYELDYELSGANIAFTSIQVTFFNGTAVITIPATDLTNEGNTTITITTLLSTVTLCGANGNSFNPVTFSVVQLGTPVLNTDGNAFCEDDSPTIADLSANVQGNITIVWFNAATNGTSYATTDLLQNGATYYASFVTASGCESPTRLEVTVDLTVCDNILIPDGFSPNGDGINDEFVIENLPMVYPNFGLEIYNRYGNLLYKGNKNNQNWNGTTTESGLNLGSNLLPTGVYFYILNFNDGVRKPVQGRVYLSR